MFTYRVEIITGIGRQVGFPITDADRFSAAIDIAQRAAANVGLPVTIVTGEGYMEPYPAEPVLVVTTYTADITPAATLAEDLRVLFGQDSVLFARSETVFSLVDGGES